MNLCLLALLLVIAPAFSGDAPKVGEVAPEFTLPDQDGAPMALAAQRGKANVLVMFYGRDSAPDASADLAMLRDAADRLAAANVVVLGLGPDPAGSHARLKQEAKLDFALLADLGGEVAVRYGVADDGHGQRRAVVLIDTEGRIVCFDATRAPGARIDGTPLADVLSKLATQPRRVVFRSQDDAQIVATLYPVANATRPAIVLFPGMRFDRKVWDGFARRAQAAGFPALAVDLRGQGDSIHVGGAEVHVIEALGHDRAFASKMVADARRAARFLVESKTAAHGVIYAGSSLGSNVALIAAAEDAGARGALLMSPGLDYAGLQTMPAIKKIGKRPVLITCAQEPVRADAQQLAANAEHALVLARDQEGHGTSLLASDPALAGLMLEWLEKIAREDA